MSSQKGYSSQEKDERLSAQFQTIEPVRELQFGSTVVAHQFVFEVGTDAAEAGSTEAVIVATGHAALKGDVIRLTSGALSGREVKVWEVATNSITLAETLPSAVAAAVTFQILRHKYPTVDSSGVLNVNSVEVATAADGGALPALTKVVSGYDGTNVQVLRTDVNGELQIDVLSSALPSGAATEATLATLATEATVSTLASEATVSTLATEATLSAMASDVSVIYTLTTNIEAGTPDSLGQATMANSMPVVLASNQTAIPVTDNGSSLTVDGTVTANQGGTWNINNVSGTVSLPTGAATETTLNAVKNSVEIIDNAISGNEMQVDVVTSALPTGAATETTLLAIEANTTSLAGCVAGNEIQVDVISSALPSGAATSANQTNGSQKTQIVDGIGTVITATSIGPIKGLDVNVIKAAIDPGNDVFATTMSGTRYNQVEVSFASAPGASLITQTFSGGGAVTHTQGHALYSTSTAASAQAKAVTVGSVLYRPGNEVYAYFTAAFTTPTSAASHQRIGIYDTNNGFFLGYEGTSFGITTRSGAVDVSVPRASFNGDLLTGAASSKFTRNGLPEAINLTYSNLFRIRFGWLGSASILFDVFSPDGVWVNFHTIKQPNSALNPSIQSPNLPITLDVQKTASDATDIVMATACWAGGTSSAYTKITDTLTDNSLAGLTRSVITGVTTGGGGGYVNVKVNPSGALVADVTGTVAATQSGTWNIATISNALPTGTNTIGKVDVNTLSVIDLLDAGILDTSATNINGSASAPTEVVAATAAATKKLQLLDTTGAFIGVYTGAALSEVLQFVMGPGSDQTIEHSIPAGTRISLKRLDSTTAVSSGIVAINFIG